MTIKTWQERHRIGANGEDDPIRARDAEITELRAAFAKTRAACEAAECNAVHWKKNLDNLAKRAALLTQRPDLPVDRLPVYRAYEAAQIDARRWKFVMAVADVNSPEAKAFEALAYLVDGNDDDVELNAAEEVALFASIVDKAIVMVAAKEVGNG